MSKLWTSYFCPTEPFKDTSQRNAFALIYLYIRNDAKEAMRPLWLAGGGARIGSLCQRVGCARPWRFALTLFLFRSLLALKTLTRFLFCIPGAITGSNFVLPVFRGSGTRDTQPANFAYFPSSPATLISWKCLKIQTTLKANQRKRLCPIFWKANCLLLLQPSVMPPRNLSLMNSDVCRAKAFN